MLLLQCKVFTSLAKFYFIAQCVISLNEWLHCINKPNNWNNIVNHIKFAQYAILSQRS